MTGNLSIITTINVNIFLNFVNRKKFEVRFRFTEKFGVLKNIKYFRPSRTSRTGGEQSEPSC